MATTAAPAPAPAAAPATVTGSMKTGAADIAATDGENADLTKVQYDPRTNVVDINTKGPFTAVRDTTATVGKRSNKAIVDSKGNAVAYATAITTENMDWKAAQ